MICPHCRRAVPEQVADARFCVWCGFPVSMRCPYEATKDAERLPLRSARNRAPAACPKCHGLLRYCPDCGRLDEVDVLECRTPECGAALQEPPGVFAVSDWGATDGTRCVEWNGELTVNPGSPTVTSTPWLEAMAYRYGLVVGASAYDLTSWRLTDSGLEKAGSVALPGNGKKEVRSLALARGQAYVVTAGHVATYSLRGEVQQITANQGNFGEQCHGGNWWLLIERRKGANGRLCLYDLASGDDYVSIDLPCSGEDVTSAVWHDEHARFLIGAGTAGAFVLDPAAQRLQPIGDGSSSGCYQVACGPGRIVLLSCGPENQSVLVQLDAAGGLVARRDLPMRASTEFVIVGDRLVVPCDADLLVYDIRNLNLKEQTSGHGGGSIRPGLVGFMQGEAPHVILHKDDGRQQSIVAVNIETGQQIGIGEAFTNAPRYCTASDRVLVVGQSGATSRIRTFVYEERQ